jgi:cell division protein ZapA (FtsZ GTPase activity inhibitor)
MPTLKTEILGSLIEINYEEAEKDKLIKIIEKFNDRLLDFKNLQGKVSDNKILFLAALKAEDEIFDYDNKSKSSLKKVEDIYKRQVEKINDLNYEIIELKDKIIELNANNEDLRNLNSKAFNELDFIEKQLNNLTKKIVSQESNHD